VLATPRASLGQAACIGDCNGNGQVNITDLVLGVNIALGSRTVCRIRRQRRLIPCGRGRGHLARWCLATPSATAPGCCRHSEPQASSQIAHEEARG
jgi:hypothetical protein